MRYGTWSPIPRWTEGVSKWGSRYNTPIEAVVIHRIEGRLMGGEWWLKSPLSGSASTHFGVGYNGRRVEVRQWVDTIYSAYGWSATPTDVPTPLARQVLGKYLYPTWRWPYFASRIDLNRPVIAIEVEGNYDKPFNPAFLPALKALLEAIRKAHGPLWVMAHTDISSKPCPGLPYLNLALPGYYGKRLDTISKSLPGFLPVKFQAFDPPMQVSINAGVNIRSSPRSGDNIVTTTKVATDPVWLVGVTPGEWYDIGGTRNNLWYGYWAPNRSTSDVWDGRLLWFAKPLCRVVRRA